MKTLLLMRHGKSSWKDDSLPDFDRPLKKRGKQDVPKMARLMREARLIPDYVLSSPAVRCRETVEILVEELDLDDDMIEFVEEFYEADVEDYLAALSDVTDSFRTVMIVGHNPTLETFLEKLTGEMDSMSTCAVAAIKIGISSWEDIEEETSEEESGEDEEDEEEAEAVARLSKLWRPKEI